MRMRTVATTLILAVLFTIQIPFTLALPVMESGDKVYLEKDTDDDTYLAGGLVIIDHTIWGDLVVVGGEVIVNGEVTGDLIAAGGVVSVKGKVGDDVRVTGGNITIAGSVGDDVFAAGGTITFDTSSQVAGSVFAGGGVIQYRGSVQENLSISGGDLIFGGQVAGNLEIVEARVQLLPTAQVQGNVIYRGEIDPNFDKSLYKGTYEFHLLEEEKWNDVGSWLSGPLLIWILFSLSSTLVVGILFILLTPYTFHNIASSVGTSAMRSLGRGFVIFLVLLAGIIVGFASVVGFKVALLSLFLMLLFFILISALNGYFVAHWLMKGQELSKGKTILYFILGLLLYELISLIPIFGWLFVVILSLMNLGALYQTRKEIFLKLRKLKLG